MAGRGGRGGREGEEGEEGAMDETDHKRKPYSPVDYQWGRVEALDGSSQFPQPPRFKMKRVGTVIHLPLYRNKL